MCPRGRQRTPHPLSTARLYSCLEVEFLQENRPENTLAHRFRSCKVGTLCLMKSVFLLRLACKLEVIKHAYFCVSDSSSSTGCCQIRMISIFQGGFRVHCWHRRWNAVSGAGALFQQNLVCRVLTWNSHWGSFSEGSHKSVVKKASPEGNSDQTQIRGWSSGGCAFLALAGPRGSGPSRTPTHTHPQALLHSVAQKGKLLLQVPNSGFIPLPLCPFYPFHQEAALDVSPGYVLPFQEVVVGLHHQVPTPWVTYGST